MDLIRWGQNHKQQTEDAHYRFDDQSADEKFMQATFREFGYGERRGTFSVRYKWEDVAAAIRGFARMNHPEALRIQQALKLANGAEGAGWHADDQPKSN